MKCRERLRAAQAGEVSNASADLLSPSSRICPMLLNPIWLSTKYESNPSHTAGTAHDTSASALDNVVSFTFDTTCTAALSTVNSLTKYPI
jgi:hypothetical protein